MGTNAEQASMGLSIGCRKPGGNALSHAGSVDLRNQTRDGRAEWAREDETGRRGSTKHFPDYETIISVKDQRPPWLRFIQTYKRMVLQRFKFLHVSYSCVSKV